MTSDMRDRPIDVLLSAFEATGDIRDGSPDRSSWSSAGNGLRSSRLGLQRSVANSSPEARKPKFFEDSSRISSSRSACFIALRTFLTDAVWFAKSERQSAATLATSSDENDVPENSFYASISRNTDPTGRTACTAGAQHRAAGLSETGRKSPIGPPSSLWAERGHVSTDT